MNREPEETVKYEEFPTPKIVLSEEGNRFSVPIDLDKEVDEKDPNEIRASISSTVNVSNKTSLEDEF